MAIVNDNDMEIIVKGNETETVRKLLKNRLFCLLKMPAKKPDKCTSVYSSSIFVGFMSGMVRRFAIRDDGSKTVSEKCEYYLSVYYKRGTDDESRSIFEHRMERKIAQSISVVYPTEDELVSILSGKELVLITNYMHYGNIEVLKVGDFLDDILFFRRDCKSDFIRRDETCAIRIYLNRVSNDADVAEHRLCPQNISDLDIGRRIINMLKRKSRKHFGNDNYYSVEFFSQSENIQAMYFATRFHSNELWDADPVNIVIARISAFVLPGAVPPGEVKKHSNRTKTVKEIDGEEYIIDAIHFNSDIFYDIAELGKFLDDYFCYFGYD